MAIIKKYRSQITSIEKRTDEVYTIGIKSLEKKFKFSPGQFLHLALEAYDPSEGWPESRCFSMQTSPEDEIVKITYAVKGAFTDRMKSELKEGKEVFVKLPYGDLFETPHDVAKTVFLAGGTGITPFLSLMNNHEFKNYTSPHLYLGLKSEAYNFYSQEIERAQKINPLLKVHYVFEAVEGFIDLKKVYEKHGHDSFYFISGPPVMINNFKQALLKNNVEASQIITDDWE